MKMKRKFISLLTVICMVLGIMPQIAFGMSGSGTEAAPYKIGTADDLFEFANKVNGGEYGAWAVLTADINLNNREWAPIGPSYDKKYMGTFDGGSHKISGLYTNNSQQYQGLFGCIGSGSEVKNLSVSGSVRGGSTVGSIAGENYKGTVKNCYNNSTVTGTGVNVGGVVGWNDQGTVENCYNTGAVTGDQHTGGIAGSSNGPVKRCYNTGTVTGGNFFVGGVAGESSNCTVENCYNTGAVKGTDQYVGGVVGRGIDGTVVNCYSTGKVTGGSQYVSGVVGNNANGRCTLKNCYYKEGSATGGVNGGYNYSGKVEKKTEAQFKSGEVTVLLQGSQAEHIWGQKLGTDSYPTFGGDRVYVKYTDCITITYTNTQSEAAADPLAHKYDKDDKCTVCGTYKPLSPTGDGTYHISTAKEMLTFADMVNRGELNAKGVLMNDIDLSSMDSWTPIGTLQKNFTGTFDGGGHKISGLSIDNSQQHQGLFGYIGGGAEVKNLNVKGSVKGGYASGGVVGGNEGTVTGCSFSGTVTGTNRYVGGVVGRSEGTVKNCYNTGTVAGSSSYVGGVVGENNGTVENCYNTGKVTCSSNTVGGVVGYGYDGTVKNCYNTGTVTGTNRYVGGVIGYSFRGTVTNCYNTGTVTGSSTGGVVGNNDGGTVTNCYYKNDSAQGGINGGDASGQAESKTEAQFKSGEVGYLLQGSQANQVWGQRLGTDSYPVFGGATVYLRYTDCLNTIYTNSANEGQSVPYEHKYVNGVCSVCGLMEIEKDESGRYMIGTAKELIGFANIVKKGETDADAILTADISVSTANDFAPIGTSENKYSGTFDGGNHTITVNLSGGENTALFAFADNATIKNLTTAGTIAASGKYAAGFVSQLWTGITLEGCVSKVTIDSTVSGDGTHGGLIGVVNEGANNAVINNCAFIGAIDGTGTHSCGGMVGWTNEKAHTTITNSYVAGSFTVGNNSSDTFSRNPKYVTLTNCYYLRVLSSVSTGATQLTEAEFKSGKAAVLLQGSQAQQIWGQDLGTDNYPLVGGKRIYPTYIGCKINPDSYSNTETQPKHVPDSNNICTVCGRLLPVNGVYEIGNAEQLTAFAGVVNGGEKDAKAVLTADIDMQGQTWTTICETGLYYKGYGDDPGYSGTFDGQGFTISNLALQSSKTIDSSCGLFGTVSGTVKNLTIDGVTLNDGGKDMRTGAVVGQLIKQGHVSNCCVKNATITPGEHVAGGIAGCVYEGTVENCLVYGSRFSGTNNRFGHIVGDTRGDINNTDRFGTVKNCYTDGSPVNSGQSGTIENCETVTAQRLESGEIAFLLQGSQTEQAWGQALSGEVNDEYPVLTSDPAKKVYKVTYINGGTTVGKYSNKFLTLEPAPDGKAWTKENGETAKDGEEITKDITLTATTAYTIQVSGGFIGSEKSATVAQGQSVTITPDKAIAGFVADDGSLVLPNEKGEFTYTVTKDAALTGKSLGISLMNGAQVRIGAGLDAEGKITVTEGLDGSGLRFVGEVTREDTLASYMGENDKIYVAVTAEGSDTTVRIPVEQYQDESDSVFTAALVNLKVANYNRVFTARVEAEINGSVVVGNEVSRSVYEVSAGLLTGDGESEITKTVENVLNAYVNQVGIRLSIDGDNVTADSAYSGKVFFDVTSEKDANGVYTITITPLGQAKTADYWNEYIRINNNNSEAKKHVTAVKDENGSLVITFDPKKTN